MTPSPDREPEPELTTTRVGGGRRVWVIALGVLLVLSGFVYVGVTGPAAPVSTSKPQPSNAVAAVTVAPTPPPTVDPNHIVSIRADPTAPLRYQYLGTALTLNGHGTLAMLDPVGPDQYRAIYRIPYALAAPNAHMEFDAVTASVSHDDLERIGSWDFATNSIQPGAGAPVIVLDTVEVPQDKALSNPDFSRISTNGYRMIVTTLNEVDAALMTIDVTVSPVQLFPTESYKISAGPPDLGFTVALETFGDGGYDGQAQVPRALFGSTVPIKLTAVPMSDPSLGDVAVGSWSLRLAARPGSSGFDSIDASVEGRPIDTGEPQILANGYDILVQQAYSNGDLYLQAVLRVGATPTAVPTR